MGGGSIIKFRSDDCCYYVSPKNFSTFITTRSLTHRLRVTPISTKESPPALHFVIAVSSSLLMPKSPLHINGKYKRLEKFDPNIFSNEVIFSDLVPSFVITTLLEISVLLLISPSEAFCSPEVILSIQNYQITGECLFIIFPQSITVIFVLFLFTFNGYCDLKFVCFIGIPCY